MIKKIFILLAIALCGLVAVSAVDIGWGEEEVRPLHQIPNVNQFLDWESLKKKLLWTYSDNRFLPDEMLDKLKQMKEASDILKFTSEDQLRVVEQVKELIELGTLKDDDCSDEIFRRFSIALIPAPSGPMIDYIDHFGRKQYKVCEPNFEQKLDLAVGELSSEQKELFQAFINGAEKSDPVNVTNGVLVLMDKQGVKLDKKLSSEQVDDLLKESIDPVCESVQAKLEDFVGSHNMKTSFWRARFEDHLVSIKTDRWLFKNELCNKFRENRKAVIFEIHQMWEPKTDGQQGPKNDGQQKRKCRCKLSKFLCGLLKCKSEHA